MSAGPTTGKEAAVRIILGEMGPLLDRTDAVARIIKDGHDLVAKDLAGMGELMTRVEAVLQEAAENATMLMQEQKALSSKGAGPVSRVIPGVAAPFPLWPMAGCCLLSATLALAGMMIFDRATIEQARIGRAVTKSLHLLDAPTRAKLNAAIQKSNGE